MTQQCVNCPGAEDHSTAQCPVMAEASAVVNQQVTAADSLPVGVPDGYMPIPTAEQIADALESVRCFHDLGAELIAPELLANLLAVTSVKAERDDREAFRAHLSECAAEVEKWPEWKQAALGSQTPRKSPDLRDEVERMVRALEDGEWAEHAGQTELGARLESAITTLINRLQAPSLPAAGSVVEDGPDITTKRGYPAYSVAQHERIVAALSAQQSAPPEFCCELSYKAAKQKAWNAMRIYRCKCDHNEYCEHCWPDDFREGGKWHGGFETKQSAHVSVPRELLERVCWPVVSGSDRYTHSEAVAELRALLNGGEA